MASKIGVDATHGNRLGFLVGRAGTLEQGCADARETVGLDDWHREFPLAPPAMLRVLLVVGCAWSQSAGTLAIASRQILGCNAVAATLSQRQVVKSLDASMS